MPARYVSTRATDHTTRTFSDILLESLAPDGGLYLPVEYPRVDAGTLTRWRDVLLDDGCAGPAFEVYFLFIDDVPADDLLGICRRVYAPGKFLDSQIAPISELSDGIRLAHLNNGPSAAFKDVAMQLLGGLFAYELTCRGERLTVLGATSSDIGSAAEYALLDRPGIWVAMPSPVNRMIPFQQTQTYFIDDPGVVNLAVAGVFDDYQGLVKATDADTKLKRDHRIGAVNSVNWTRPMAQVVYYSTAQLHTGGDSPVSFVVPSGNFGNIAAGHIAHLMGLPIRHLVLATNENDVLDEFFRTGVYRPRAAQQTHATSSPSMDVSKASNFERFIADLLGRGGACVTGLFGRELPEAGKLDLSGEDRDHFGFISGSSTHADQLAEIRATWGNDRVLIDPHTADGVYVARRLLASGEVTGPIVVLETALPVKFAGTITQATGIVPSRPDRFAGIEDLPRHVTRIPVDVDAVRRAIGGAA